MTILLTAATEAEIASVRKGLGPEHARPDILVTGAGLVPATYALTRRLAETPYDLVIRCGLAGTFRDDIAIGEVVRVEQELFGDAGAMDDTQFLSLFELGLADPDAFPFQNGRMEGGSHPAYRSVGSLRGVTAMTVSCASGNEADIRNAVSQFQPDIETMEGAATSYVCLMETVHFIQLCAISNKVERRNRAAWNIELAAGNLAEVVLYLLKEIKQGQP
jgi:futalosine hydrolase